MRWRSANAFRPSAPRSVRTARALRSHCAGAVRRGPSHCAGAVRKRGAQCDFRSAKMGVSAKKSVRSAKENSAQCAQNSAHCAVRSAKNRDAVRRDVRARGATPAAHTISPRQKHRHECARERREASRPWRLIWWIRSRQSPWAAPPNGAGRTLALTSSRCCRDGDGDGAGWTGGDKPCRKARGDRASVALRSRLAARRRHVLATCRAAGRLSH